MVISLLCTCKSCCLVLCFTLQYTVCAYFLCNPDGVLLCLGRSRLALCCTVGTMFFVLYVKWCQSENMHWKLLCNSLWLYTLCWTSDFIVNLTSFRSIFCFDIFCYLLFWANVDSSDWCVACDCHLCMHQCSGIHWFYTSVYRDKSLQQSNVLFFSP